MYICDITSQYSPWKSHLEWWTSTKNRETWPKSRNSVTKSRWVGFHKIGDWLQISPHRSASLWGHERCSEWVKNHDSKRPAGWWLVWTPLKNMVRQLVFQTTNQLRNIWCHLKLAGHCQVRWRRGLKNLQNLEGYDGPLRSPPPPSASGWWTRLDIRNLWILLNKVPEITTVSRIFIRYQNGDTHWALKYSHAKLHWSPCLNLYYIYI